MLLSNFLNNVGAAYNLTVIGLVLLLISSTLKENSEEQSLVASAGMMGAVAGQLLMGFAGDCLGRQKALILTTLFICVGSILSSSLPSGEGLFNILAICRFVTGFGVGGVYPLTAVASSEVKHSEGSKSTLLVFSGQGWGQLLAAFVVYLLELGNNLSQENIWRITLGLGSIPSLISFILLIIELRRNRNQISDEAISAILRVAGDIPINNNNNQERIIDENDVESPSSFRSKFFNRKNFKKLLGTGLTWFLFDISFYANVVFAPIVLERVFGLQDSQKGAKDISGPTCIILLIALPGYYLAVAFATRLGLKRLQMIGFLLLSILYAILAGTVHIIPPSVMFALYSATFLISNFGPNSTTFCLPSVTFPKEAKSTFNGISAAMGKMGAIVGTSIFPPILDAGGISAALGVSSIVAFLGFVFTYFLVETENSKRGKVGDASSEFLVELRNVSLELPSAVGIGSDQPSGRYQRVEETDRDHPFIIKPLSDSIA